MALCTSNLPKIQPDITTYRTEAVPASLSPSSPPPSAAAAAPAAIVPATTPSLRRTILTAVCALSTDRAPRHTTLPDGYTFTVSCSSLRPVAVGLATMYFAGLNPRSTPASPYSASRSVSMDLPQDPLRM